MRGDIFQAIAKPNRRAILDLWVHQTLTVNGVAAHFSISRPAISRHIKILAACGLVKIEQNGRERTCHVQPDKLNEVADWITQYQQTWEQHYERLDELLEELQAENAT